jgi:prefoldin subunit 5
MKVENLAYPWKKDMDEYRDQIRRDYEQQIQLLKSDMQNMQNTINNLRTFSQDLYDRLNIGNSNYNSNPINKVY